MFERDVYFEEDILGIGEYERMLDGAHVCFTLYVDEFGNPRAKDVTMHVFDGMRAAVGLCSARPTAQRVAPPARSVRD